MKKIIPFNEIIDLINEIDRRVLILKNVEEKMLN